jgi:arginine transport system substrate-binding protein
MKKIIILALMFLMGCNKSCQKSCQKTNEQVLRIGTNPNFPPFETINDKGEKVGFDIDVGEALGKELGLKVIFKEFDFDGLILALNKDQIDIILSGMSITESRKKEIAMVPYQGEPLVDIAFMFWHHIPVSSFEGLKKLAEKKNLSITVQSGHFLENFLREIGMPLKLLAGPPEQVLDIKYGKSLAAAVDSKVGYKLALEHSDLKSLILPLPKDKWDLGYGIGIKKTRLDLIEKIKEAVLKMEQDGTLKTLKEKWFKDEL